MDKKILLSIVLFFTFLINYGQCTYPISGTSQLGTDLFFCIDNNTQTFTRGSFTAMQYVSVNVVKGFKYTFSVPNIWNTAGNDVEYLGLFNDAVGNSILAQNSTANGASVTWEATFSGKIRVLLLRNNGCSTTPDATATTLTLSLNSIGNKLDSPDAEGLNTWRGHIYNYAGGGSPGNFPSPTMVTADVNPFFNADYVGYYDIASDAINEIFIANAACFPVFSDGNKRAEIYTETFAVRYRMNSKKAAGCYLATFAGDDGVRLYVDGVKVFDEWKEQAGLAYNSVMIYLSGDSHLVLDYYENAGGNIVTFSLVPFDGSTNKITAPTTTTVCGGITPGTIVGSNYSYNGATVNPTIKFQWQYSSSATGPWTDATTGVGFASRDYTPAAITESTINTTYYRRRVSPVSNSACYSDSTPISITTNPKPVIADMTASSCSGSAFTVIPTDGINGVVPAGTIYTWSAPTVPATVSGFASSGSNQTSITGTLTLTNGTVTPQNVTYTVTATKGSCTSTFKVIVTVYPASIAGTISGGTAICAGTNSTLLTLSGSIGSVLRWESSTDNFVSVITPITNAGTIYTAVNLTTTTSYRAIVQSGNCAVVTSAIGTITTKNPIATGATICQGGSGSLTASGSCTAVVQTPITASGTGGISNSTSYGNTANTNISINFPVLPVGAVVVSTNVTISFNTNGNSYLRELRVRAIPPAAAGVMQDDLAPGGTLTQGSIINGPLGIWGTGNPAGNWTFAFREDYLDYANPDANITNITITVNYALPGTLDWYTVASGGTKIGSGSSFNPVGVANSGLLNTNTAGIFPYYVACSNDANCRTRVDYIINPLPTTPVVGAVIHPTCIITTGSVTLNGLLVGGTLKQTGTVIQNYSITTSSMTVPLLVSGTYQFAVDNGTCPSTATAVITINAQPAVAIYTTGGWSSTPAIEKSIVFANNYNSEMKGVGAAGNLEGCSCTVNSGVNVIINSGATLTITNSVTVNTAANTSLTFENNASLVQTTNATNTGDIIYKRISSQMKALDYTYWSSPVLGQKLNVLSPNSDPNKFYFYNNGWQAVGASSPMVIGKGYIIRVPKAGTWPGETVSYPYAQPVVFKGVPNNGIIPGETITAGNVYLVGNPYPSAIDADKFILDITNNAITKGTLYFWTHNTAIADKGSLGFTYTSDDYASYNITGSTVTKESAISLGNKDLPTGKIAAGQSFMVESTGPGTIVFNNGMRIAGENNQFFRPSKTAKASGIEKNRVWLNLINNEGAFKQILIGYIEGATNGEDNNFDGAAFNLNSFINFYSINDEKNYSIQGRALPFIETDIVPLGYSSTIKGDFTIEIDKADGSLSSQVIYLEDKAEGIIHNLTQTGYTFKTAIGTFDDRFVLRYTNKTLDTGEFETAENEILVSVANNEIKINAISETIDKVFIYDITGKLIYKKDKVGNPKLVIENLKSSNQVLLVKVVLDNKHTETKKIIF
ncbi:T9SS sorting signal type C domain-containing protein [Flavobacterium sp. ALJ2]|uniref:T9SS sorting signal type C domain-containing protein n=1 Tax=Flavobacterium sp. ALJ2 TaxID=2786960 RepID=UPI0018A10DA8|nr:T9SS sorting signal type C domain-containing protein [Flavobacterium sp. ALJ2]MBF7091007.1 T9SS sorting signal type C domain-containing protein [Flavobacterium sp. ALJ2]